MFPTYNAYAQYICGSTDTLITVYIDSSNDKERALEICGEYAKEKKGIYRTWLIKAGRKSEYCVKMYA